MIIDCAI